MMLWFANLLIVIGIWTLGYRWRHAFLFSIAGESVYTLVAWRTGQFELAFICGVFCILAARNWWLWRKTDAGG